MSSTVLRMETPAASWRDALPCGNGAVGALVYGRVATERILFNHEALWSQGRTPPVPETADRLDELRTMLADGDFLKAETFFPELWKSTGVETESAHFLPGPDLCIQSHPAFPFEQYESLLEMNTGEVKVQWKENGYTVCRRVFVSRTDRVAVVQMTSENPEGLNLLFSLQPHDSQDSLEYEGFGGVSAPVSRTAVSDNIIRLETVFEDQSGYQAEVKICGGNTELEGEGLRVTGTNCVTALIRLAPVGNRLAFEWPAWPNRHDYAVLLSSHAPQHSELMDRVQFSLDTEVECSNERMMLDSSRNPVPPELVERLFLFGRYLMVSCSTGPAMYPSCLQGIWNGDYIPAWTGGLFIDENILMNYWPALSGSLPEALLPFFNVFEACLDDFRENARRMYGCRGILLPVFMSPQSGRKHDAQPHCVYWTAGGGWVAQHFFDYFLYTGDREFLKDRALPFMMEVARFYEDFFTEDDDGNWVSAPSVSPENYPLGEMDGAGSFRVCVNATMDFAVARELFSNLILAAETLELLKEDVPRWVRFIEKIPAYQINEDGAICEWMDSRLHDNDHHRHLSHIYPLFPGRETCRHQNPELFEACRKAVENRLVIGIEDQTGWSLAHMASIYARLKEGNKALDCIRLLVRSCLGKNFFTYHNSDLDMGITKPLIHGVPAPFQIDANFGVTAAVLEMLLFCRPGEVHLLPALPDAWPKGKICGIRAMGGICADIQWDEKTVTASLTAGHAHTCTVFCNDHKQTVNLSGGTPLELKFERNS